MALMANRATFKEVFFCKRTGLSPETPNAIMFLECDYL